MLILLPVAGLAYAMIRGGHSRYGWLVFTLGLAALVLFAQKEQLCYANANLEHELGVIHQAEEHHAELVESQEALYTSGIEANLELGKQIYTTRCTACHAIDRRVVGPPYQAVVPKYANDLAKLTDFIQNPVKVDPDYPAMPDQGLRAAEAKSVAAYLLNEITGQNPLEEE
jgi:cytochrome c